MQECSRCGKVHDPTLSSSDFCPDCVAAIRAEHGLRAQLHQLWVRWREPVLRLPLVTLSLVATNIAIYAAQATYARSNGDAFSPLTFLLAWDGVRILNGEWWRLFTSAFVHVELVGLLFDVLLLSLLGWMTEPILGCANFLFLWLVAGTAGSIALLLFGPPKFLALGSIDVVYGLTGALFAICLLRDPPLSRASRNWRLLLPTILILLGLLKVLILFRTIDLSPVGGLAAGLVLGLVLPVTATERTRTRLLATTLVSIFVLLVCASVAKKRQEVWVELDEIDPEGGELAGVMPVNSDAIPKLERIVARRPDILRAHALLAEAYQSGHRYEDAFREYRYVLQKQPYFFYRGWYSMGWALMDSHRYNEAIDAFSRYLDIVSKKLNGHGSSDRVSQIWMGREALAKAFESAGRIDDAIAENQRILEQNPKDPMASQELHRLEHLRQLGKESK